jgi:hypothetical protein
MPGNYHPASRVRPTKIHVQSEIWYQWTLPRGKQNAFNLAAPNKYWLSASPTEITMKKLKNENALFKEALLAGVKYAEGRGVVEFEATDSASEKLLYLYRLLVHDKVIQALPEEQVAEKSMRHKLAIWYSKQLPKDHPLLK